MKINEIEKLIAEYNTLNTQIKEGEAFTTTIGDSLCNRRSGNAKRIQITPQLKEGLDTFIKDYTDSLSERRTQIKNLLEG